MWWKDTQPSFDPHSAAAAVARAIAVKGSQRKLAATCGVSQALIAQAKIGGRLSARLAIAIHPRPAAPSPARRCVPICGARRNTFR